MTQFDATISTRISQTRQALDEARTAGDDYEADVRLGELQSLARLAAEHGVRVDGVEETLTAYGLPTPEIGMSVVDLRAAAERAPRI